MNDDTKNPVADPRLGAGPTKPRGVRQQSREVTAAEKLAMLRAEEEERQVEAELEERGGDWFVRCRRCNGAAVFLVKYPEGGWVEPDNWYATYRDKGVAYITDRIQCQECEQDIGVWFPRGPRGPWQVPIRYIQSPEDIEERAKKARLARLEIRRMREAKLAILDGEDVN